MFGDVDKNYNNFILKELIKDGFYKNNNFYQYISYYNNTANVRAIDYNNQQNQYYMIDKSDAKIRNYSNIITSNPPYINVTINKRGEILFLNRNGKYKSEGKNQFKFIAKYRSSYNTIDKTTEMGSNTNDIYPYIISQTNDENILREKVRFIEKNYFNIVNDSNSTVKDFNQKNKTILVNSLISDLNFKKTNNCTGLNGCCDCNMFLIESAGYHATFLNIDSNSYTIDSLDSSGAHETIPLSDIKKFIYNKPFKNNNKNLFNQQIPYLIINGNLYLKYEQPKFDNINNKYNHEIQGNIGNCGLISAITMVEILNNYHNIEILRKDQETGYFALQIMKKTSELLDTPRSLPLLIIYNKLNNNYNEFYTFKYNNIVKNYEKSSVFIYSNKAKPKGQTGNTISAMKYSIDGMKNYLCSKELGVFYNNSNCKNIFDLEIYNFKTNKKNINMNDIVDNNPFIIEGISLVINRTKMPIPFMPEKDNLNLSALNNLNSEFSSSELLIKMAIEYNKRINLNKCKNPIISGKDKVVKKNKKNDYRYKGKEIYTFKDEEGIFNKIFYFFGFKKDKRERRVYQFINTINNTCNYGFNLTKLEENIKSNKKTTIVERIEDL